MSGTTEHILFLVELAAGIVAGFVVWSYVSPMLSGSPTVPTA